MTTDRFASRQASKSAALEHGGQGLGFPFSFFPWYLFVLLLFALAPEPEHSRVVLDAGNKDAGDKRSNFFFKSMS